MVYFFKVPFANSGDRAAVPLAVPVDNSVNYETGYPTPYQLDPDTEPTALNIPRNQFNQLAYAVTQALQQYQTLGFPDFITTADNGGVDPYSYSINATVRFNNGWAGTGFKNYYSLVDANTADPTDSTKWGLVKYSSGDPTGVGKDFWGIVLPDGYVWANGTTIGNASSGATGRANADTVDLFTALWNALPQSVLPIQTSAGAASTRGASAAADYAANKRLPTPDKRGRVSVGKDDLGGAAAVNRITTAGCAIAGTTMGANGGAQNVSLTAAQNGQHAHTGTTDGAGSHNHLNGFADDVAIGVNGNYVYGKTLSGMPGLADASVLSTNPASPNYQGFTSTVADHTHGFATGNSGTGDAHLNVQPSIVCNYIIKL